MCHAGTITVDLPVTANATEGSIMLVIALHAREGLPCGDGTVTTTLQGSITKIEGFVVNTSLDSGDSGVTINLLTIRSVIVGRV
jgi:hypothetical protein